jgi:hypothetical protein
MTIENLREWLKEIVRYDDIDRFVKDVAGDNNPEKKERTQRFYVYTQDHIYSIYAVERVDHDYLGCTVSTRKPRAGEDWNRGSDLADGPLNYDTWRKIKNDIIGYELVPLDIQKTFMKDEEKVLEVGESIE